MKIVKVLLVFVMTLSVLTGFGTANAIEMQQGSPEQSRMEMQVLQALEDEYCKGAAWDIDSNTIFVTVFTEGDALSNERLRKYEQVAAEVTGGINIVIKIDSGSAPSELGGASYIELAAGEPISVNLDGRPLTFDVPPQIINDRTMVPLRAVFEAFGAKVEWDGSTQTVTGTKGGTVVMLTIGSASPTINGKVVIIDQPGIIVNGRTLAPLRFVGEAYGGKVDWDGATGTVNITSGAGTAPIRPEPPLPPARTGTPVASTTPTIEAIVLNEKNSVLMFYTLDGINSSLVSVNTAGARLTALDSTIITEGDFRTGQIVTISYDGAIAESYPGRIFKCFGIHVTGEADKDMTAAALDKWTVSQTREDAIFYVDSSGALAKKTLPVTFGDYFGAWKKANNVPDKVELIKMTTKDNAYEETDGKVARYTPATSKDFYLDLSKEFLPYLASVANEQAAVASLVKTIIGENPPAKDTAVFLTVLGVPLKTDRNDFSGRLTFDIGA